MMALNVSIMILGLQDIRIGCVIISSLCMFIVQWLEPYSIFILIEKVIDLRQFVNIEG